MAQSSGERPVEGDGENESDVAGDLGVVVHSRDFNVLSQLSLN